MTVKKFNAVCTWVLTVLLLTHIVFTVIFMLTGWYDINILIVTSRGTAFVCILHVLVSLYVLFFLHDRTDMSSYAGLNRKTIIQRATGLAILALVHPHISIFTGFIYEFKPITIPFKVLTFIVEALFFFAVFCHLGVSFSGSFITMGLIRTDTAEKRLQKVSFAVCLAGLAASVISLAVFLFKWPTA